MDAVVIPDEGHAGKQACVKRHFNPLLHERGIDVCHETIRFWWHKFGQKPPNSAASVFRSPVFIYSTTCAPEKVRAQSRSLRQQPHSFRSPSLFGWNSLVFPGVRRLGILRETVPCADFLQFWPARLRALHGPFGFARLREQGINREFSQDVAWRNLVAPRNLRSFGILRADSLPRRNRESVFCDQGSWSERTGKVCKKQARGAFQPKRRSCSDQSRGISEAISFATVRSGLWRPSMMAA